jgi:hypothetical protein
MPNLYGKIEGEIAKALVTHGHHDICAKCHLTGAALGSCGRKVSSGGTAARSALQVTDCKIEKNERRRYQTQG